MINRQLNKRRMFVQCLLFFSEHAGAWAGFTVLEDRIADFVSKCGEMDGLAQRQGRKTLGITKKKKGLRAKMAEGVTRLARKAHAWATDTGSERLRAVFDVQRSRFMFGPQSIAVSLADNVLKALDDNAGALVSYGISAGDIAGAAGAKAAFAGVLGETGDALAGGKAATTLLAKRMKEADGLLAVIDDLLISEYAERDVELVRLYRIVRRTEHLGVRHTGLHGQIKWAGTGEAAEGVVMEIEELKTRAVSDIDGDAKIIKCKPGTFHVVVSGAGVVEIVVASV